MRERGASAFLLRKSALDKKLQAERLIHPPGVDKRQKYCFVWEWCDYSASFA
jgi:hypothetical protein